MEAVTISPKFQVVIPLAVRQALRLRPGQKVQVLGYQGRIELVPLRPMREMRGFAKGVSSTVNREPDRV